MARLIDRIRAAAFDLDGTLVDSAPDLAAAANAMLKALGNRRLAEYRITALIGDGVDRLVEGVLTTSLRRAPAPAALAAAGTLFRRIYAERLFDRSRVYPGVVQGLGALRKAGIRLCCVTNKHSAFTAPLLDAAGLARRFAFALCADRAEERKPKPDLLLAACARFGIAPAELLYVGDSRADIGAARAAGCPVAAVDYGYNQGRPILAERPDWVITSLAEIAALSTERTLAHAWAGGGPQCSLIARHSASS